MPKRAAAELHAIDPAATGLDLAWIGDLPATSRSQVEALARHLHETAGNLTPADVAALSEFGRVAEVVRVADNLAAEAAKAGDTKAWASLSRRADQSRTLLRGLLKDLRLSRNAGGTSQGTAGDRKIKERSGSGWQGLL
jgi:phage protein D